jgi:hypothetical protein
MMFDLMSLLVFGGARESRCGRSRRCEELDDTVVGDVAPEDNEDLGLAHL